MRADHEANNAYCGANCKQTLLGKLCDVPSGSRTLVVWHSRLVDKSWIVWGGGQHLHFPGLGAMFSILHRGIMYSKLCSPNQVTGGRRTHSVSALLLVSHTTERTRCRGEDRAVEILGHPQNVVPLVAPGGLPVKVGRAQNAVPRVYHRTGRLGILVVTWFHNNLQFVPPGKRGQTHEHGVHHETQGAVSTLCQLNTRKSFTKFGGNQPVGNLSNGQKGTNQKRRVTQTQVPTEAGIQLHL